MLIQGISVYPGPNCPGWDKPGAYFLSKGGKTEKDVQSIGVRLDLKVPQNFILSIKKFFIHNFMASLIIINKMQ